MAGFPEQIIKQHTQIERRHRQRENCRKGQFGKVCSYGRGEHQRQRVQPHHDLGDLQPPQPLVGLPVPQQVVFVHIHERGQRKADGEQGAHQGCELARMAEGDARKHGVARIQRQVDDARQKELRLCPAEQAAVVGAVAADVFDDGELRLVVLFERRLFGAVGVLKTADGKAPVVRSGGQPADEAKQRRARKLCRRKGELAQKAFGGGGVEQGDQ